MSSIYALLCPVTRRVMYIGGTKTSLARRLGRHWAHRTQNERKSPLVQWLRTLNEPPPIIELRHVLDREDLRALESWVIADHLRYGGELLNTVKKPGRVPTW